MPTAASADMPLAAKRAQAVAESAQDVFGAGCFYGTVTAFARGVIRWAAVMCGREYQERGRLDTGVLKSVPGPAVEDVAEHAPPWYL